MTRIAVPRNRPSGGGRMPRRIGDEAFIEAYRYDWDPWRAAAADVVACEAAFRAYARRR